MSAPSLDEGKFNMEIRKFLKKVGITSQHEIERAVHAGLKSGKLTGTESLDARVTLVVEGLDLHHTISDKIALS